MKLVIPLTALFIASCFGISLWIVDARHEPAPYKFNQADSCFRTQSKEFCTVINESFDGGLWLGLPHRPINELTNWGQGRNPGPNDCPPGTVRYELDDGLFLECMR